MEGKREDNEILVDTTQGRWRLEAGGRRHGRQRRTMSEINADDMWMKTQEEIHHFGLAQTQ